MEADVQYNDFIGTAAADIADALAFKFGDGLGSFGKYFKVDEQRFKVVGISIDGTEDFCVSLLCVDKKKSTEQKEHIVNMSMAVENPNEILDLLFKRLSIVLYPKSDDKYSILNYHEEGSYEDFHE